jgi:hypothetical protein
MNKLFKKYLDYFLLNKYSLDRWYDYYGFKEYLENKKFDLKKFGLNKIKNLFNEEWSYLYK